jgi:hypothetical protein
MGDLNAHNEWWQGSYVDPKRSRLSQIQRLKNPSIAIANWFEEHNFYLHNKPDIPTHYPTNNNNPSVIDLCFSKGEISDKIITLSVNHDSDSDQSIIGLQLQGIRYNQLNRAK